jgi:YebC/PmpR family DNA-binding regulatory protein
MAGHSKWAQIKRQKGVTDQKRGAAFAKLANAITIAARNGIDPTMNFQLRIAIDKAKTANMPKDNIERAIDRVKGGNGNTLEEVLYEAYGPEGTAFLIETATDNRNRTVGEIRAILNKMGGKLAESGSVGYLFKKRGEITVNIPTEKVEETELAVIEAGAADYETDGNKMFIYTDPQQLEQIRQKLSEQNINSEDVGFEWQPLSIVPITDKEKAEKIIKLSELLEDLDDITKVSSNFDIPADLLQ